MDAKCFWCLCIQCHFCATQGDDNNCTIHMNLQIKWIMCLFFSVMGHIIIALSLLQNHFCLMALLCRRYTIYAELFWIDILNEFDCIIIVQIILWCTLYQTNKIMMLHLCISKKSNFHSKYFAYAGVFNLYCWTQRLIVNNNCTHNYYRSWFVCHFPHNSRIL